MRPGVARLALEALNKAPLMAKDERPVWFRRRQDEWLRERWADATRLLHGELADRREALEEFLHGEGSGRPLRGIIEVRGVRR